MRCLLAALWRANQFPPHVCSFAKRFLTQELWVRDVLSAQEARERPSRPEALPCHSPPRHMSEWILGDPTSTNAEECAEYVAAAGTTGETGLFAYGSEHAFF